MKKPNIIITGTPGTGKSTLSSLAAEKIGLKHIDVGEFVKANECHEGFEESFQTYILDEDKLCELLEPILEEGGNIIDFHTCDIFPEMYIDLLLVLRSSTTVLYDRLIARGYDKKKLDENMECEIMQVVLEDARANYSQEIIYELERFLFKQFYILNFTKIIESVMYLKIKQHVRGYGLQFSPIKYMV